MQLIKSKKTRLQLWNRKAIATRWGVSCIFPRAKDTDPVAVAEAHYTVDYDTMIEIDRALAISQSGSLPDYAELTKDRTTVKYADEERPYIKGHYSTQAEINTDRRKAVLAILGLKSPQLPTVIVLERLV